MKIVILDGYTLNPGDLSWDGFERFGEVVVYDKTDSSDVFERSKDADILISNKTVLSAQTIEKLDKLKYIGLLSTGYNVVDVSAARKKEIPVCNVPAYCTYAVVQSVFALIFEVANRVGEHNLSVHAGDWKKSGQFCYWKSPLIELQGKTMGVVGFGRIGRQVAQAALTFGMKVVATGPNKKDLPEGCVWLDFKDLLRQSDVISIHCPLNEQTQEMINKKTLSLMKESAILINTSRGGVICEKDLADALNCGKILAACLDVLSTEPPSGENPLLKAKNCIITPHIAWAALETRKRLMEAAVSNVECFIKGDLQNTVF